MLDLLKKLKVYTFIRTQYIKHNMLEQRESNRKHWHDFYQLVYVYHGAGCIITNEKQLDVSEGDFAVIARNEPHTFVATSKFLKTYELKFDIENDADELLCGFSNLCFKDIDGNIKRALKQIEYESDCENEYCKEIVLLELCKILLFAQRAALSNKPASTSRVPQKADDHHGELFESVSEYIDDNIAKSFTVKDVALYFHADYTYFSHFFSEKYGIRLSKLINEKRIARAQELIITTDMTISDISSSCGFKSLYCMDRVFKKIVGMSPTDYRQNYMCNHSVNFDNMSPETFYENTTRSFLK